MSKYLPTLMSTVKGHLNQAMKNVRFAQVRITTDPINSETHLLFTTIVGAVKV